MILSTTDRLAVAVSDAIRGGDLTRLERLLAENPGLAAARIVEVCSGVEMSRSLLHVATDWPGSFPSGAAVVSMLVEAGADVNARFGGRHSETPLHWAASSDDVAVLDALLDAGADIEATGGVIAGGTPLADATAFGQWKAARRLIERGAQATLWQAAALGLMDLVEAAFTGQPLSPDEVTKAFWAACHGGQRQTARYLLERGANLNWVGYDGLTPLDAACRSGAEPVIDWLGAQGARSARDSLP